MPVYAGHLKTAVWEYHSHEETVEAFDGGFSYQSRGLVLSDHGPTHVDSFSHFDPSADAPAIDQMDLAQFCGPATCIDVSHADPHAFIGADQLDVAVAKAGGLLAHGDVLLLHTGTHKRLGGTPAYSRDYPGLDEGAAEWLVAQGVKAFGVDSPSPDNPISRTYPVHMMCRREHITHYENLANLDLLVGRRFTFIGFPLRIRNGTGSPVRAVAVVPGDR
jgi:kynurenine formamidase